MKKALVVCLAGIWEPALVLRPLARRLWQCGYEPRIFPYSAVRRPITENAARLNELVLGLGREEVHFVGHSFGGLVIRRLFHDFPDQPGGRIVTLGSPHGGSRAARRASQYFLGQPFFGHAMNNALDGQMPPWEGQRDLGVITGTLNLGLGRLFVPDAPPGDGVVFKGEDALTGARDHVSLNANHMGLLFSREVARQTCNFLKSGNFINQAP